MIGAREQVDTLASAKREPVTATRTLASLADLARTTAVPALTTVVAVRLGIDATPATLRPVTTASTARVVVATHARVALGEALTAVVSVGRRVDASVPAALQTRRATHSAACALPTARPGSALVAAAPAVVRVRARVDTAVTAQRLWLLTGGPAAADAARLTASTHRPASTAVRVARRHVGARTVAHDLMLRTPERISDRIPSARPEREPQHRTQKPPAHLHENEGYSRGSSNATQSSPHPHRERRAKTASLGADPGPDRGRPPRRGGADSPAGRGCCPHRPDARVRA